MECIMACAIPFEKSYSFKMARRGDIRTIILYIIPVWNVQCKVSVR